MAIEKAKVLDQNEQFENQALNELTKQLIRIGNDVTKLYESLRRDMRSAFVKRWEAGKLLHDNHAAILEECGTMKEFCEMTGFTEAVLSNNLRGYRAMLSAGATTADQAVKILESKRIEPTSRNFEKIGTLLSTTGDNRNETIPQRKTKAELADKQLENLNQQVEAIRQSHVPDRSPGSGVSVVVHEEAAALSSYIEDLRNHKMKASPVKVPFRSEIYTEFIRNYPRDIVTMLPLDEKADPHHANEFYAKAGEKINDLWQIPVSRQTHQALEEGHETYDEAFLNEALVELMANYIMFIHNKLGIK